MSVRKAVEIANLQQAPMVALRAAIDLARMAGKPDEQDDARALLAEALLVLAHTKADLPDLCDARALFNDLTTRVGQGEGSSTL
jgi:hypothetical protein